MTGGDPWDRQLQEGGSQLNAGLLHAVNCEARGSLQVSWVALWGPEQL